MSSVDNFIHDLPPSIKKLDTGSSGVPDTNYEAYLYRFTNLVDDRIYVGIHKGYVGDGYWHSSSDEEFRNIFASADSELTLQILKYGSFKDMQIEEARILTKDNAKDNPKYINKSNGSVSLKNLPPDMDVMNELAEDIRGGKYPVTKELIEDIYKLPRLQVRLEENKEHRQEIRERIDDAGGNTDKCSPVVIYEKRGSQGQDVIGDGNHTVGGAKDSKHATHVPVIRIPLEVHRSLTDDELVGVGNILNQKPEIVKLVMSTEDAIKYIIGVADTSKVSPDAQFFKDYLKTCGFTRKKISIIIQKAKQEIEENAARLKNQVWIDYRQSPYKERLNAKVEQARNSNTMSIAFSSGMFKWEHLIDHLASGWADHPKKPGEYVASKPNVVIFVYHPSFEYERKWKRQTQAEVYDKLHHFFAPAGYNFTIIEMPSTHTTSALLN